MQRCHLAGQEVEVQLLLVLVDAFIVSTAPSTHNQTISREPKWFTKRPYVPITFQVTRKRNTTGRSSYYPEGKSVAVVQEQESSAADTYGLRSPTPELR